MINRGGIKGQITIFIIIAIIIVAIVALFFVLKGNLSNQNIPKNIVPVHTNFLNCLEETTITGIDVLSTSGGYIYQPEFEPGSNYMPFSSHLNFAGSQIPYWYYVSGNNIEKEQVPTKNMMESQLERFIEEKIRDCDFEDSYSQGYQISKGIPKAKVSINDKEVVVDLTMDLGISYKNTNTNIKNHKKTIRSNLGSLYDSAIKIYDYEQEKLFLEEYAMDVLWLYAPVDGIEISCSPLFWDANEVFNNLEEAIEINTLSLSNKGSDKNYFKLDLPVQTSHEVRFINSRNWAKTFEVSPTENSVMSAFPIGNQPGLGVLGFCYIPYKFIYDLKYPVLIQISEGDEVFQFPMAVIIQNNNPRKPLNSSAIQPNNIGVCLNKNSVQNINVYDSNSKPISNASISYECFGEICNIGQTSKSGNLNAEFPQCVNGRIIINSENYGEHKEIFSTVDGGNSLSVHLKKQFPLKISLKLDGINYNGEALISFVSEDSLTKSIYYPEQKIIDLSEGFYNIEVQIYKNTSIDVGEGFAEQCIDVPFGILGIKRKKCFEIQYPERLISKAVAGGGKQDYYFLENELNSKRNMIISVNSFPIPNSFEKIQDNYILFNTKGVEIKLV